MILIFDLMDTLIADPFYENFFNCLTSEQKKLWLKYKNHEQYILFEEGKILENEYFKHYYKENNIKLISGQKMKKLMFQKIEYLPEVRELLIQIRKLEKTYMVLASNYSIWYNEVFKKLKDLEGYFDFLFFSCEVGYRKPDEKFFQVIQNSVIDFVKEKDQSDDVIFFDDKKENCLVGEKFGWKGIWIENKFYSAQIIRRELEKKVPAFFNAGK